MSDLVGKVARRMCCSGGICEQAGGASPYMICQAHTWNATAHAAIAEVFSALLEPSEVVLVEGFENYPTVWTAAITAEDRTGIWQAMLTQARKEALGE